MTADTKLLFDMLVSLAQGPATAICAVQSLRKTPGMGPHSVGNPPLRDRTIVKTESKDVNYS